MFENVPRFRANRGGPTYLNRTEISFLNEYPNCSSDQNELEYYYQFEHIGGRIDTLNVSLMVCCGDDDASFDALSSFVAPDGFDIGGQGAAFEGDDSDTDYDEPFDNQRSDDDNMMKKIIVYCVCGALFILSCLMIWILLRIIMIMITVNYNSRIKMEINIQIITLHTDMNNWNRSWN